MPPIASIKPVADIIRANVGRVIVGKQASIDLLLIALLCNGHALLEDVPGVGKTMLARALALSLGLSFRRLQCTPDLLPNDMLGVSIYHQQEGTFRFQAGPIFTNVLLVDEINRATPRTQSALLEAMGEGQVTVDGETRILTRPFFVLATQNPIEFEGTFPLPEAQLDRFLVEVGLGYPSPSEELEMLERLNGAHPIDSLTSVAADVDLVALQQVVQQVHVAQNVRQYIIDLATATRQHTDFVLGASPRATLALFRTIQARAALEGRDFAIPDDVKALVHPVWKHRLLVRPESRLRGRTSEALLQQIVHETPLNLE